MASGPFDARHATAHPRDEDRGAEAGAQQAGRVRRRVRRCPVATKRRAAPRSESSASATSSIISGTPRTSVPELWDLSTTAEVKKGESIRVFPLSATGPNSTSGSTSTRSSMPMVPLYLAAKERPVVRAQRHAGSWSTTTACRSKRARPPRMKHGPFPHARLLPADRRRSNPTPTRSPKIIEEMLRSTGLRTTGPA